MLTLLIIFTCDFFTIGFLMTELISYIFIYFQVILLYKLVNHGAILLDSMLKNTYIIIVKINLDIICQLLRSQDSQFNVVSVLRQFQRTHKIYHKQTHNKICNAQLFNLLHPQVVNCFNVLIFISWLLIIGNSWNIPKIL